MEFSPTISLSNGIACKTSVHLLLNSSHGALHLIDVLRRPQGGEIFGLPRGSYRLPSQNILDLRIEKQLAVLSGQFRVTAYIFNVFNAATVTGMNRDWGSRNYGRPTSLIEPRQIRLGLRYTF